MLPLGRVVLILAAVLVRVSAQSPSVPYAQFFGPDLDNVRVDYLYSGVHQSIQKVDFRNMRLVVFDKTGKTDTVLQFKNGSRKWKDKGEINEANLEEVDYLTRVGASEPEYALVVFHWISVAGGTDTDGFAQVFRLANHQLRVIQQLRWNEQFETKEKYAFDATARILIARSAHYLTGDAHCCVSAMDVFTLQWDGSAFVPAGVKTELSDYGKREGKTLTQ